MESKMRQFSCPHCDRKLAAGIILFLEISCPDCGKFIFFELVKKRLKIRPGLKEAKAGVLRRRYGRDKLDIEDMKTTKEGAEKAGHSHFFDGEPCRYNHISPKTRRGECYQCTRESTQEYNKKMGPEDKEKRKKYHREYVRKNIEKDREYQRTYRANVKKEDPQKNIDYQKEYRKKKKLEREAMEKDG